MKQWVPIGEEDYLGDERIEVKSTSVSKEYMYKSDATRGREFEQIVSVRVGRGGGLSPMATPLGNIPRGSEPSELYL